MASSQGKEAIEKQDSVESTVTVEIITAQYCPESRELQDIPRAVEAASNRNGFSIVTKRLRVIGQIVLFTV